MNKILIIGDLTGHHRSQIFIQALMHKDMGSAENFQLSFASPSTYKMKLKRNNLLTKLLRHFVNLLTSVFFWLELAVKIPFSDKIYFLAMNHRLFIKVYLLNLIWRKPLLADLYISLYDAAYDRGLTNERFFRKLVRMNFTWYLKLIDRMIIEKSNHIIYVGKSELDIVAKVVGAKITEDNVTIIPPASKRKKIANPQHSDIFRICWWGTFTNFHGVDTILQAATILKNKGVHFRLDLFGTPIHDSTQYEAQTKKFSLEEYVNFHKDKTFGNHKLEEWLARDCDLALGNFSHSERALRAVPTKIIDAFSMRLPVVTMDTAVLREYANVDTDLFVCIKTPEALAEFIYNIVTQQEELLRRAERGYILYESKFSPEAVQKKFIETIRALQ